MCTCKHSYWDSSFQYSQGLKFTVGHRRWASGANACQSKSLVLYKPLIYGNSKDRQTVKGLVSQSAQIHLKQSSVITLQGPTGLIFCLFLFQLYFSKIMLKTHGGITHTTTTTTIKVSDVGLWMVWWWKCPCTQCAQMSVASESHVLIFSQVKLLLFKKHISHLTKAPF